ncbi:dTDP-4-dehydrorhamnose reductase [Halomonas korlensis]|uniref:dTDP-4-dehydrorhamnose reductase n=2 Tax=Halomonas korlensis TaxID=463301 RepID=A0A1I7FC64_9GAMM|nr:dTDP-4-dehydrorhamnose reductase [Halomonas korlensis]
MTRVIAVVLTYNRQELLQCCLDAIQQQTRRCDDILVINNASTDGTREMLESGKYSDLKVYSLKKNMGAAGGFNAGFRLAYDNGADYVWMMDDDVIPETTALERLLEADALLEEKGAKRTYLLSTAFTETGQSTNTPQISDKRNEAGHFGWPEQLEHGLVAVCSGTFVSILLPRSTLKQYGLPISSMFIWGEDAEFTLRITREAPGYLVGASRVAHIRHGGASISIVAETNPVRIGYYKNFVRNNIFLARKYKTRRRLFSVLFNNVVLTIKMLLKGEPRKAYVVMVGLTQSLFFNPHSERVDADYDYSNIEKSTTHQADTYVDHSAGAANPAMFAGLKYIRQS